jgi:hypothetical protein
MSRVLRRFCGDTPATEFGPKRLKALREYMLAAREEKDPKTGQVVKRAGWCRTYTNRQVKRVQLMFRWAASKEMVPASVPAALGTVAGLRRGAARESEPVEPVADELVDATLPHLPPPVKAMVQLQRLTGARGGELFPLRTCDIDMTGDVWKYRPEHHKTAHHDHDRVIFFGPQAQEVLRPFLRTDLQAYLFQPREWAQWRYDKQKATLRDRKCRSHYTKDAYAVAIARACGRAFPPPARLARDRVEGRRANGRKHVRWETKAEWRKRLGDEGWKELEK